MLGWNWGSSWDVRIPLDTEMTCWRAIFTDFRQAWWLVGSCETNTLNKARKVFSLSSCFPFLVSSLRTPRLFQRVQQRIWPTAHSEMDPYVLDMLDQGIFTKCSFWVCLVHTWRLSKVFLKFSFLTVTNHQRKQPEGGRQPVKTFRLLN